MGRHVLLIEDEPNIIEAIRFILTRDGWQVSAHSDGADALRAIRGARPDVLVLDVMLPGRSGFEVLQEMRGDGDPALSDLPVLMLTAKGQERDREHAERLGATRFMTKPFANTEILAAVRALAGVEEG